MTPAASHSAPEQALMAASGNRPVAGPPAGSAWQPPRPGHPRPLNAGSLALTPLPVSPGWARQYARIFLDSCRGLSEDAAETAVLLVSELVTNAVQFTAGAGAGPITLSIRQFRDGLLIEV